ncbi:hypothetical protein GCM10011399_03740 [Subtercola lobariae]|uniref:Uncharacterized protein n=1 Tax=Subtercola lobariae TaxID=1588641 RepID=A0A917ETD2_9MICO|nr:hypothetical protein GCM10011399_03740 [Subtercola lobariae]
MLLLLLLQRLWLRQSDCWSGDSGMRIVAAAAAHVRVGMRYGMRGVARVLSVRA